MTLSLDTTNTLLSNTGGTLKETLGNGSLALVNGSITVTAAISSFSPGVGPVGSTVVITGASLTGATAVRFNGVAAATFTVDSATQITVTVPTGATTGAISVVTPSGTATSSTNFTVRAADVRGDANGDAALTVGDVFFLINHLFAGGPAPTLTCLGDANGDGAITVGDVFFLINHLFAGGPAPGACS